MSAGVSEHSLTVAALDAARARIQQAYAPELAAATGRIMVDEFSSHLAGELQRQGPVLNWSPPPELIEQAGSWLTDRPSASPDAGQPTIGSADPAARFQQLVRTLLQNGINLHHPRYLGHQVPAPVPLAGWMDGLGAAINNPMAVFEMGPWATACEQSLVRELGQRIGWNAGEFSGFATHGGSLANLTALLTARNVAFPDCWQQGWSGPPAGDLRPVIVTQADAHYCVARAAGMLGIGTGQVIKVPLDERRRMNVAALGECLAGLRREGRPIVAVVACAGTTLVGAFDPLEPIADVCAAHGVWLHVDAAHGGGVLFSSQHRHLLRGLDRADSVVWDAHKMLFVPALCTFTFYRHAAHKFVGFAQDAPYLFDPQAPGLADYDQGLVTVECTKRAQTLGLWGVWSTFGDGIFADLVNVTLARTQDLYELLSAADDFETLHVPECNILTFRYRPGGLRGRSETEVGEFQRRLRRQLIESGRFYIVQTTLGGVGALRVTLMNPLTTNGDLLELLAAIRETGTRLLTHPSQT